MAAAEDPAHLVAEALSVAFLVGGLAPRPRMERCTLLPIKLSPPSMGVCAP